MEDKKLSQAQFDSWAFAAVTPPLIQMSSNASWLWLALLGLACILMERLRDRYCKAKMSRWLCLPGVILMIVVLGELAGVSAESWPRGEGTVAVPLALLALAAWSASKGAGAAARVGVVLFIFINMIYILVLVSGAQQLRFEWLRPISGAPGAGSLLLLLVPLAGRGLPVNGNGGTRRRVWALAVAVGAVLLTGGILSPDVASMEKFAFYEMCRSLELLGVARRFEALICAAATAGWFSLMALLLSAICELVERAWPGWGRNGVWAAAALAAEWMLCGLHIYGWLLLGVWTVFWVLLPILTQGIENRKKS